MEFFLLVLLAIIPAYAVTIDSSEYEYLTGEDDGFSTHWLKLPLDHFNLFDNRTWDMRYFVNKEFFKKGSPLFIEVGGEWTIDGKELHSGQIQKLAEKHNGMLVETEHRYYGNSVPLSKNYTIENLKYLQVEQALEDLAFFIEHFKASTPGLENSKVVLHGCSYPGMLATWMRLRFPHIVDISYASSAPLGVDLDYPEYYEIVSDTYANVSVSCIGDIKAGFAATAEMLKTKEGRDIVRESLRDWWHCSDFDIVNSVKILQAMLNILNVQNDPLKFEEVSCLALSMDSDDTSAFHRLVNLVKMKSGGYYACPEDYEETRDDEAWYYQTCTEVVGFQTLSSANSKHPFAMDLTVEESVEQCVNSFGETMSEQILRTGIERVKRRYGGQKPKVTKVVTVQATNDPWRDLADLEDYTPEAPVIVVTGTHCIDTAEEDNDPEELLQARKKIRDIISKWLEEM